MRRILVLRGGALGDFIVTLPALALLRQRWPDARLELVGNATAATLVPAGGLLDAVHSQHEARWAALFGDDPLPDGFQRWLANFDLVVNYWPDADGSLGRRFPARDGQQFLSASAMPSRAPAAAHYCAPLLSLGLETRNFFCGLDDGLVIPGAVPSRNEAVRRGNIVALHPGSGSPQKNWPLDRWRTLAAWIKHAHGAALLIISGEAEPPDALGHLGRHARNLPLPELARELSQCRLFLGHDSGVSHLAAACGVPGILLFGPTDPVMWAPPAPHVTVIRRGPDVASISLADVQAAVTKALADQT
ncbi:MAG: glycosyltransferase family 9 protein [Opitutaceae bacterium]|nr:glycosyltransferase family 9 protein [Opitutaceae bacterium]